MCSAGKHIADLFFALAIGPTSAEENALNPLASVDNTDLPFQ